mgnify:CR=1 FL=1
MRKNVVVTLILLLTIGVCEISAQSFLERLGKAVGTEIEKGVKKGVEKAVGNMKEKAREKKDQKQDSESVPASTNVSVGIAKATQKAKSKIAKLDKTKMYTQEQADSYYPLSNPRTLHIDNDYVTRERLTYDGDLKQQRARNLNVNKLIITVENLSYHSLAYTFHNLKEVWCGPEVDVAAILENYISETSRSQDFMSLLYPSYSLGIHSRECTLFLPAEKYPKGIISIQEEILKKTGDYVNWKSVPSALLRFKTLLYTGDVNEAAEKGASACKAYCPGHDFSALVVAAHTVMRHPTCQANPKFYYSCKYCGECEHNPKHTFEKDKFWKDKTQAFSHAYVKYDLSEKNYVGRNAKGEKVYQTSCYWCGHNGKEEILNFTQEDLRMAGHDEITLAQYKEMMLSSWDAVQKEEALANVFVGGFDYPGFFAVPDDDHGAKVNPKAENDTRWAMANGLIDKEMLGTDYLKNISRKQLASLAVRLAEQVTGKSIKAAPAGTFTDSDDIYLLKAYAAGIIPEQGSQTINPDATVTRQEMASYMFNALQYIKEHSSIRYTVYTPNLDIYSDKGKIADWALEAMGFMNTLGFVKGTTKNTIDPLRVCTIEEAVVLAHKCFYADELGWYQCIRPDERGYAGSPGGAYDVLGIQKMITAFPVPYASAGNIIWGYDNGSRFWVGENWIGRGLLRKSQKEVMLPIVDKYTGTTVFVPGEEFLPIKDI